MLSPHKIEKIRKYSNKKFWERLQELNEATQNTEEEEAEADYAQRRTFYQEDWNKRLLDSYNSAESVARRNDIEELDELTDKIDPKFDELDKVKLKTNAVGMVGIIPAGSEGFVMDILSPDFARYRKTKEVMYRYEVKIEIWDLETFKIILHDRVTVDEDEIEGIDTFTIDQEFINRGGKLPPN